MIRCIGMAAAVWVLAAPSLSFAQEHRHELGTIRFEISCRRPMIASAKDEWPLIRTEH
jgi:hypothetical protein